MIPDVNQENLDPLLEWGLREQFRNDKPRDLADSVQAVLQRDFAQATPTAHHSWLAAASVLFGTIVVLAIALWPRQGVAELTPPNPPDIVQIASLAEAKALPITTRAVEAIGVDDATIAALIRLRHLEVLIVREPWNESFGLGLKLLAPKQPKHITNACWQHFAQFTKLRTLRLSGTSLVARIRSGSADDVVSTLEKLPLFEELALRALDCDDLVLQRLGKLPNLRRLDLSFNHGFTEAGIQGLLQCEQLCSLTLQGCQQLYGIWMATLAALPNLEILDVRSIDGRSWRNGMGEPHDAEGVFLLKHARGIADSLSRGVNDLTLLGLARAPRLRVLEMGNGLWTARGLIALGNSKTLRELNMFGGQEHDAEFVKHLPRGLERLEVCANFTDTFCHEVREHLPNLRHLNVAACDRITDAGMVDLLQIQALRVLDMRQMRGLTEACMDALLQARQLEELDIRHNDFVTADHVLKLERALPHLRTLQSNP